MQNNVNSLEELQRLLKDERDRCNLHKQNYQEIKDEYTKLQEELTSIYEQLKETRSKNESLKTSHQSEIRKLESKIKEQNHEIAALNEKVKLLDSKKLRDAVLEEAANHYESKIKELELETDRMRNQFNNLHYENSVLKCKYESRESEYSRTIEKIKLEYIVEIEHLQNRLKNLEKENSVSPDTYAVELKSAKREISDLNSKIKVLLSECEELRAQNENLTLQINDMMRSNSKQSADYANNLRFLESEKIRVTRQLEMCEKELANAQEHRKALNVELQTSKQEMSALHTKIEDIEHNSRLVIANLQDEKQRNKSEFELEREELIEEIANLRTALRNLEENSHQEQQLMLTREQEIQKDLISARQQFWKLSNEIQLERERMERKVMELETDRENRVAQLSLEIDDLKQKLHLCTLSKVELEKEFNSIRQNLEGAAENISSKGKEVNLATFLNYEREIQDLKQKFELLVASCSKKTEQTGTSDRAFNVIERDNEILQMKLTWEQQKLHFQQRLEELESQLRDCRNSSSAEKRELEFKIKQYTGQVSKLKEKLESQKEKLLSQKEMLEKCVPAEIHLQIKNQLLDLQRRLEEYRRLITTEPGYSHKQPSSQIPTKMLTDIKNISFRAFSERAATSKGAEGTVETIKDLERNLSKKKSVQTRRKSSIRRDKNSVSKPISPVLTSSSDIDWENL